MRVRVPPSAPALILLATALLTACDRRGDTGPVVVSAIGGTPTLADPGRTTLDLPGRLLLDSIAQGLVQFDAAGQVEPGLAERWIVGDDGASYIFRIRPATWSDGTPVTARAIVRFLRRQTASDSRNPLAPFLTAIDEIVEMTPQVIEIRLKRPRPDLLKLFAQPELAVVRLRPPGGGGPFRVADVAGPALLLRPAPDPARADPDDPADPRPEQDVRLIGERAGLAVVRFARRDSDLVTGGTVADWPLVAAAGVRAAQVRVDPAAGLFGLAVVDRSGFLADAQHRRAIAGAIDRQALAAAIAPGWPVTGQLLPDASDSARPAVVPGWTLLSLPERQARARDLVTAWPGSVSLRIALPRGPGATLVFGRLAASLRAVGIAAERVGPAAGADLRLVDAVAPYDSARWYLATACVACGAEAQAAIMAARDAPTLPTRAEAIAAADLAMEADAGFIPLARPWRWSLVASRLGRWQANVRAWHPLNRLRRDTN